MGWRLLHGRELTSRFGGVVLDGVTLADESIVLGVGSGIRPPADAGCGRFGSQSLRRAEEGTLWEHCGCGCESRLVFGCLYCADGGMG